MTDAEIEDLNNGTHASQTVPKVFSEGSNPNSQTNGGVRFSKESFDPFGVESNEQKEIWKNAILSLDTPRRALAPGTSGITKPLSAANVRKLDDITKGFEHLKRDIAKKSLNRDDFLLRISPSKKQRKPFFQFVDFVFDVVPVGFSWRTSSPIKSCSHIISFFETQPGKRKT